MNLDFDLGSVELTEFGVGRDDGSDQTFFSVPVDEKIKAALREIVQATWATMHSDPDGPAKYEASEKHGPAEYLYLSLGDALASPLRDLCEATNLPIDTHVLEKPGEVFCYFARLRDSNHRHLTAVRRATYFKGVLRSRLIQLFDDTLRMVEDRVFKLDNEFDFLVDSVNVHIWRPSGFESVGKLQEAIKEAVPGNVSAISVDMPFVDFAGIQEYAGKHTQAARSLASIREQAKNIDKTALLNLCANTGVRIAESQGKITIPAGSEMGFLEVLDRRRYQLELIAASPERYRAGSRRRL
ncbi:MAG TPA: Kiwa anti-phage protein KwaB-like domain-containing protein [Thermoanaerobaculia bacterium]|jgi:hypothetical protein|nr:Kiwa anti-phage protein KwaB-like domain-containing protein [Thermoanaerobaculia bacterium]